MGSLGDILNLSFENKTPFNRQEDAYILEIVRCIYLNPLRAKLVANLNALARYRFYGHCTLIGKFRERCTTFKVLRGIGKKINGDGHILRDAGFIERVLGASKERLEGRAILMAI